MSIRKTQRKNKTKQVINWPQTEYFTIDTLIGSNSHMLTSSGSDITLRVRLNKAITEENIIAVIGHKNCGKGRPQLAFAIRPVPQSTIDKAKSDGISIVESSRLIPVMNVTPTQSVNPATNIATNSSVAA